MNDPTAPKSAVRWLWRVGVFLCTFSFHTFAFPPYDVAELAYVLPIPMFLWLFYGQPSRREFLGAVGGAFWLSWLVLLFWLRHVTWVGWFGLGSIMAVFPLVWTVLTWWLVPKFKDGSALVRILGIMSVCSVWALLEFLRTFFLSGFPWLPLAASQWQRPLTLQIASWTGFYGVSFLLLFVGIIVAFYVRHLFKPGQKGWFRFCPEFILGMAVWIFATFGVLQVKLERSERETLFRAALVQPYVPQPEKWDPAKSQEITSEIERQIEFQKHIGADIAVLPEAVLPHPLVGDRGMQLWAESLAQNFDGPVLLGALAAEGQTMSDDPWYNGFMIVYPEEGVAPSYYKKRRLVPYGEYIPFRNIFFFLEKFVPLSSDIAPGNSPGPLKLEMANGPLPIGPLICYEDIFPSLAIDTVRAGALVLFVVTNDAWYGEEGAAYQHAAHSVLRAVETFRPVVRVGNGGWSGWIDEYGNIREVLESATGSVYFRGSEVVEVTYDPANFRKLTFFVQHPHWFLWMCGAIVALFLILVRGNWGHSEEEEWAEVEKMKIRIPGE
jgi:apolipoprotein N-acyltransferase